MARPVSSRIVLEGELVARTPLHAGSGWGDADVDLAVAVNGAFDFYAPGTSVAGALRAWCDRNWGSAATEAMWGRLGDDDDGFASRIVIDDAIITPPFAVAETRDGVGIDRVTGAAAPGIKYSRAVLPRGSVIPIRVVVDVEPGAEVESVRSRLLALANALHGGQIRLGAGKTRGLGRVELRAMTEVVLQLDSREGMLATLRRQPAVVIPLWKPEPADDILEIDVHWKPDGPLMVKAAADGDVIDSLPLTSAVAEGLIALVLPGSSVKGALRFEAERITRTLLSVDVPDHHDVKRRFLDQLDDPTIELVRELCGTAGKPDADGGGEDTEHGEPLPGLGALSIDDCYAGEPIDDVLWREVQAGDAQHRLLRKATHVAIDRWTGGAADQLLFTVLEPRGFAWEPLRLTLDLSRLSSARRHAVIALLVLLVDGLKAGRVPLGFAVDRGMGALVVDGIEIRGGRILGLDPNIDDPLSRLRESVRAGWTDWVREAREARS